MQNASENTHLELPSITQTPTLAGIRFTLRAPREGDKADRLACPRSAEAVRMYGRDYRTLRPVTVEEVEQWYGWHSSDPLRWMIEAEGRCIGNARLTILDEENRRARYAIVSRPVLKCSKRPR